MSHFGILLCNVQFYVDSAHAMSSKVVHECLQISCSTINQFSNCNIDINHNKWTTRYRTGHKFHERHIDTQFGTHPWSKLLIYILFPS